ncbi:MAG: hypothetical protein CVU84_09395 [Firmicutes bacterium HGW-Firmicutes-1]|nr:MAG: hypothetical protein CVU84_09395 [Firmicutes bacterium HGW-Firmicutes-1]
MNIDMIVNEVIRRIKLMLNTHKGLIVIREKTDYSLLNILLLSMKDNGFIFDAVVISHQKEEIELDQGLMNITFLKEAELLDNLESIHKYEVIVLSNLNIIEIGKLTNLNIENKFLYLVYEALKEGKEVYGFSKDLDIKNNINLRSLTLKLCKALEDIGLKMIIGKNEFIKVDSSIVTIDRNVITLECVNTLVKGSLLVQKSAILTNAAKDYLSQNKIDILRR